MRLTLDLDNCGKRRLRGIIKLLEFLFPGKHIKVWRSASGKGYHVVVYMASKNYEEIHTIRKFLGDDPVRLAIDVVRNEHGVETQILFSEKRGEKAKLIYDNWKGGEICGR